MKTTDDTVTLRDRIARRLSLLVFREQMHQFGARLKANALWMKQFLHGSR